MIPLRDYQVRAVDTIADGILDLAQQSSRDRLIVLTAPTGAGKTVILAAALDQAAQSAATLWLTPGKGGLADQTAGALRSHLSGSSIAVERLTETWLAANASIRPGTILVANWESLTQTDSDTGARKNRLTRDGEQRNIFDALRVTADAMVPLIVVIDESHWGITATGTTELLEAIDSIRPALRIETSATPIRQTTPEGRSANRHRDSYISLDEVISEGMLATEIRVNAGLQDRLEQLPTDEAAGMTGEALVLDTAIERQAALEVLYRDVHSSVRPLVLVQIPDGRTGAAKLDSVEAHLAALGISRENGRLAVWLSEDKTPDLDLLAQNDSPADVLIFKQAVAVGWDCPRAQVLVAFREMQSTIFAVQTVGRILRTPERRHYGIADLDAAYIFANIEAPKGPRGSDPNRPHAVDVTLSRQVGELSVSTSYASRAGTFSDIRPTTFRRAFADAAASLNLSAQLPALPPIAIDSVASDRAVETSDVLDDSTLIAASGEKVVYLATAEHDLQAAFDSFLASHLGGYRGRARSVPVMRQVIYDWMRKNMTSWAEAGDEVLIVNVQALINDFSDVLGATLDAAVAVHRSEDDRASVREVVNFTWQMPAQLQVSSETHLHIEDSTGYAFLDANGTAWAEVLSGPEVSVATLLAKEAASDQCVMWWWKQSDGDRRWLSLAYEKSDGSMGSAYPDFVAELHPINAQRRRIALLEAKSESDRDPETAAKAAALARFASELRELGLDVVAGIVAPLPGGLAINVGANYSDPSPTALTDPTSGWNSLLEALRSGT